MSTIATAVVVTTGASMLAGKKSAEAQRDAAREGAALERELSDENLQLQKELTAEQREDFKPWREAGGKALEQITAGIESGEFDVGSFDVRDDPGYQFRMDEGLKAIDRSASAGGRLESGAYDKAINRYAQDYASGEYANAYARNMAEKDRRFNMLAGLSDSGQSSAARQASATSQLASNAGNILANEGRMLNVARGNEGAAKAQGYMDTAKAFNQGAQNWLTYKGVGV